MKKTFRLVRRAALVAALTASALLSSPSGASTPGGYSPSPVQAGTTADGGNVGVSTGDGEGGGGGGPVRPSKPVYEHCSRLPTFMAGDGSGFSMPGFNISKFDPAALETATGFSRCERIDDGTLDQFLTQPPQPNAALLVAAAQQQLVLDVPDVATSPPRGAVQLVGVPVWFWVDNFEPGATTATVPGLAATLTATPAATHIAISGGPAQAANDHVTIDCPGAGTPWVEGRYDARAASDCSHPFDWNGTFTVDATVDWALTWTASNGQAGTLPIVSLTSTFTLTIQEGQSLTD